jgi:hypothetical protein
MSRIKALHFKGREIENKKDALPIANAACSVNPRYVPLAGSLQVQWYHYMLSLFIREMLLVRTTQ